MGGDLAGGLVVQHLEAGRDPRLQREAAQQLLAETVDGLDPEAARRLQRPGEQGPGQGRVRWRLVDPGKAGRELVVVEHRPFAETLE